MAKKQFSLIVGALLALTACQHRPSQQTPTSSKSTPSSGVPAQTELPGQVLVPNSTDSNMATPTPIPGRVSKAVPQFAIIFSGGGAKAWAHVGILKEFQKFKFPIVSVAGIEWGSVVAATYASNLSANEVEWEMSKIKTLEESGDFIRAAFLKKTTNDLKIPFVCPSLNLKNQTAYLLNRGNLDQLIPYCLPSAGLVKPYAQSTSLMVDVAALAQHLRATGAQRIILVNVLGSKGNQSFFKGIESLENQQWVQASALMAKKIPGVDEVVEINLPDIKIDEFDKRRDAMAKGSEIGYGQIKKIADKFGL